MSTQSKHASVSRCTGAAWSAPWRAKKTNQSSLITAPADAAEIYEKLRAAVLSAQPIASPGLGILHGRGLAAWIRALEPELHAEAACCNRQHSVPTNPSPPASDVTCLLAGIILSLAMEPVHA